MQTVVHVTHEAIQKIGGIGAVLHGLFTSQKYLDDIQRNILIGPYWPNDQYGELRLGSGGEVLYSSLDNIFRTPLATRFREIESHYNVSLIYGRRRYIEKGTGVVSSPEVLLIDVARFDQHKIDHFKYACYRKFGLESARYQHIYDFEQYMRLAPPAVAALHALGASSPLEPCVILSHEYMGIPTCLAAVLEADKGNFRSIFYAHEVATVRRIVEEHPGHDTMFYNVMRTAMAQGHFVEDAFGDQSDFYKHALLKCVKYMDGIFAVGDYVQKEFRFLGSEFVTVDSQLAYNGVPCWKISVEEKMHSRHKLQAYCKSLLRFKPDYVFSHVTRLVPSKGLWRDLRVLEHLEPILRERNETAVLFALSTEIPGRRPEEIRRMEEQHKWPVAHREGLPDLSGGEAAYYQGVQEFNACSRNIKVVFVNQFGWEQKLCGSRMPADMEFMDIRKGSDVEFGQSIYEPFGIAQVEPVSFGGICVFSNVCGCSGFVEKASQKVFGSPTTPNVIVADYTELAWGAAHPMLPEQLLNIGQPQRDAIEHVVAEKVAKELFQRLPRTPAEFEQFIDRGYALAQEMSWDAVARDYVVPGILRASKAQRLRQIA